MSLGKSVAHDSGRGHATGESVFIDDRPFVQGEIYVGYLGTPVAKGRLKNIDTTEALRVPGILGIYTHKDVHHNFWGTIFKEQPFLVEDHIGQMDEPIAVIASESMTAIKQAKELIKLDIEKETPIFTIDEALAAKNFISVTRTIKRGNCDEVFKTAPYILEDYFENEGQEHFYLESQAAIAYPLENHQIEVHSSSQHPTEVQHLVAEVLGIKFNQVVSIVKRMGGGFGGKESQAAPFAAMAALAAHMTKRPARIILTKDDDMMTTGKRHPFKNFYKVAFDNNGKILALKVNLYSNGGAYADLSTSIMERAMLHMDGAYFLKDVEINGQVLRTNLQSNTAFRGFGGPQGTATIESILEDIAITLKKDSYDVRRANIYEGKNNTTPYGQEIDHNPLPEIFDKLRKTSGWDKRVAEIKQFNATSKTHLKGISITATKFGIAFTAKFLNQGNAQVNVHLDGTIQVSTGATEMGQGVNTKIQQIVAHAFGVPASNVQVMPTSTEKNHNTSPTAASSGSDLNGAAAYKACEAIKNRLNQMYAHILSGNKNEVEISDSKSTGGFIYKDSEVCEEKSGKKIKFAELLNAAYFNRVQLGEYAFYKTPGLGFDKEIGKGIAFNYFTNGAAVSEVLIDQFTGELKVTRADILMDLGRMINPAIDRGQVTGAFVQGQGWVTTEKLVWNAEGRLTSHSPTTYKIPNIQDTPRIFNVDFIENPHNHQNVHGHKAVGEPPFLLPLSVWNAVKNALSYKAQKRIPKIKLPATSEEILMELDKLKNGN